MLAPEPFPDIMETQTWKVLSCWRENFGLSMTPHLLCHVMERSWLEIRAELLAHYSDGFFRVLQCPDIKDVAYYVDYPFPVLMDQRTSVHMNSSHIKYSDRHIKTYPITEGYINSWAGIGLKELKFREKALTNKDRSFNPVFTPEQIIQTLRAAATA